MYPVLVAFCVLISLSVFFMHRLYLLAPILKKNYYHGLKKSTQEKKDSFYNPSNENQNENLNSPTSNNKSKSDYYDTPSSNNSGLKSTQYQQNNSLLKNSSLIEEGTFKILSFFY